VLVSLLLGFRNLPVLAQWALLSVGKAFGGSLILAFAANYATAYFAIRHGFRVPLEGVPYLSFAVGIAGFVTFLLAMPLFLVFVGLAQYTRHAILRGGLGGSQGKIFGAIAATVLGGLFLINLAWFLEADFARGILRRCLPPTVPDDGIGLVAGGLMAAAFFSLMAMWTVGRGLGWIGAQLQAWLLVLVVMFVGLFWYDCYGSFLRLIRYGGGIEVTVRRGGLAAPAERTGRLLWMTESQIVLFDPSINVVEEIPRTQIMAIVYAPTPPWYLPDRVFARQLTYIRVETRQPP
jgi:hypothetical protein